MTLDDYIRQLGLTADPLNAPDQMGSTWGDRGRYFNQAGDAFWATPQYGAQPENVVQGDDGNLYTMTEQGLVPYQRQATGYQMDPYGVSQYEGSVFDDFKEFVTNPGFMMLAGGIGAGLSGLGAGGTGLTQVGSGALETSLAAGDAMGAGGAFGGAEAGMSAFDLASMNGIGGAAEGGAMAAGAGGLGGAAMSPFDLASMNAIGGSAAGGAPAVVGGGLSGLLSQIPGGAGTLATLGGALAGSQGQSGSQTTTQSMNPALVGPVGDLTTRAGGLLAQQQPGATAAGNALMTTGQGLLGSQVSGGASNPYLSGIADDIGRRQLDFTNKALQGGRSNFVGAGNFGSERQKLFEADTINQGADNYMGQIAGLYGNAYNQDQGRNLQSIGLGADLIGAGQNAAFNPLKNTASIYQPFTGYGSNTTSAQSGGGALGALGGGLGAAQLWQNLFKGA